MEGLLWKTSGIGSLFFFRYTQNFFLGTLGLTIEIFLNVVKGAKAPFGFASSPLFKTNGKVKPTVSPLRKVHFARNLGHPSPLNNPLKPIPLIHKKLQSSREGLAHTFLSLQAVV